MVPECSAFSFLMYLQMSTGLFSVKGLFIIQACVQANSSLCCIFILKQKEQPDGAASSTSITHQTGNDQTDTDSSGQNKGHISREKEMDVYDTNSEHKDMHTANEKTRLTETKSGPTNHERTQVISIYGLEIMKLLDFWLLMISFIIGSSLTKLLISNFGTYLRSFQLEDHLHIIMTSGPWLLLAVKICVGLTSDLLADRVPRIAFFLIMAIINVPIYFAFIFRGDNVVLMYTVAYGAFISNGIYFLLGPVLIAEYFGVKYFGINYGAAYLADGLLTLLLQFILGLLYDVNVSDVATHTCYGLHCYYVSSGILCALSIVTLTSCILLFIRRCRNS